MLYADSKRHMELAYQNVHYYVHILQIRYLEIPRTSKWFRAEDAKTEGCAADGQGLTTTHSSSCHVDGSHCNIAVDKVLAK